MKFKDIVTKKINIFGRVFFLDKLIVITIWSVLAMQSIAYLIPGFMTGTFLYVTAYIFLFSLQVGFVYFNILTNKMKIEGKL